ncbi:MAG: alcohol dehydrogenase [Anaerolineales bacterium]|nr:zinc-binding dehydrogenase [Anaerolineae bacterium]PWB77803.1 MAG: alcohol dehydrogenase [Anaerolineales bacterium]
MRAAVFHQCGDASQIKIEEVPEPQIGAGQALIRVHASAFNHLELWALHGPVDESYHFPMWTGSDMSGVIERLAPDVTGWSVGEAVVVNPSLSCGRCERCLEGEVSQCDDYDILGSGGNGGNAEFVAANVDKLMRMPEGFDFVKAAAAPLAYQTAWRAVTKRAKLQKGEDVLILGASGGVAVAAIQISKMLGARVFAVTSSEEKMDKAQSLGADFVVNRKTSDPFDEVHRLTRGRGVDLVIENVGAATWSGAQKILRKGGRIVTYGRTTGREAITNLSLLFWNEQTHIGSTMGSLTDFREVMELVFDGTLDPVIDSVFPLEQAADAYARYERGEQFGKIVLQMR